LLTRALRADCQSARRLSTVINLPHTLKLTHCLFPLDSQQNRRVGESRIVQDMLGSALQHHQAGRLAEAERIYRQILAADAQNADGLHLLGMVAHAEGRHEAAVEMIAKAIAINPKEPHYHSNLGTVLQAQGKLDEALACFAQSLALKPDLAEVHSNFGNILQAQGKIDEAAECQQRALALKPDCAEAHFNLGNILKAQGKLDEAVVCYERAVALKPVLVAAQTNLGSVLYTQGKLDEAVVCLERALALRPNYAEAHSNLGSVLQAHHKLDEAVACYERALALKPDRIEVLSNLGTAKHAQDLLDEAVACYERALALKPDYAEAHHNMGCVLFSLGNVDEALARHRRALAIQPDYPQARFAESLAQLAKGDFAAGWHNYESRWTTKDHDTPMRAYAQPLWAGEKLASGRLLIWGEQGIGDEIMFAGLIPDVIRTGNLCVLDCIERLKPLFARSFPEIEVVSGASDISDSDIAAHLPAGSLPALFRTSEAAFGCATSSPYLIADPSERKSFRNRYADGKRLVGLAWHTNNRKTGRGRSMDLSLLAPLFARSDIRWVSLQYGDHDALEGQAAAASAPILIDRSVDQFRDMDVFAAQIAALDLVVTIDNSTAHLAGALGVPVWLLLPYAADWRWMDAGESSPWYPGMRLFRQPKLRDWPAVVKKVQSAL
jgi:tetratricopeptide (TPR) repeat protein